MSLLFFRVDRRLLSRVAVVLTAVLVTGVVATSASSAAPEPDRPSVSQLGFDPGYANTSQLQTLQTWLGRKASYVVQFAAAGDTLAFESSVGACQAF